MVSSFKQHNTAFPRSFVKEHFDSNVKLQQLSLFPYSNSKSIVELNSLTFFRQFRSINFEKKRALPFFLTIELLTSQKSIAVLASRPVRSRKIRKGILVGCRVTLRNASFFDFVDLLSRTVPRRESFKRSNTLTRFRGIILNEFATESIQKTRLFSGRRKSENQIRLTINTARRTTGENFSLGELPLFPPFERGLGLHPDITSINLSFSFTARTVEERLFLLRTVKLPFA